MQGTIIGLNTAAMKLEDRFLALMLKVKQQNHLCHNYYFQLPALIDLLLILSNRMAVVINRIESEGDAYKEDLISYNQALMENMPPIDMAEVEQPDFGRRVTSVTLKPGDTYCTLILVLQNEQIATLKIDDRQAEAFILGIKNAVHLTGDKVSIDFLAANLDFIMLYTVNLTNPQKIDYKHFQHQEWKLSIFTHYLAVLFCYETNEGKHILDGAVIKTSASHPSAEENNLLLRLADNSKEIMGKADNYPLCQIFSTVIAVENNKILSLEECLQPLHDFYTETQKNLNN